jgi:hypothetical protein
MKGVSTLNNKGPVFEGKRARENMRMEKEEGRG